MKLFPFESQAVESVHQGITTLLFDQLVIDQSDIGFSTAVTLSFGAHAAWINSFIMTVAGHIDSGWTDIRRAIEFTCYASKVINSKERAEAWMQQRTDSDARKIFSRCCRIPHAYTSTKYSYLRDLIVNYDIANYYGAHANLETLIGKYHNRNDSNKETLNFTYQANKDLVYHVAPIMILNGYRILQALRIIFHNKLQDKVSYDRLMKYIDKSIIDLRIDLAKSNFNNKLPSHIAQYIYQDKKEETDKMFEEMLERENIKKQ